MLWSALALSCGEESPALDPFEAPSSAWVGSDRTHLRDEAGRVVILRGVNARVEGVFDVTFDDGREALEPIPAFSAEDARRMRAMGLNVLRLPINWSGVEPEQGRYDEAYLDRVEQVVAWCAEAGVHVLIDFHQDAYSKHIGEDGAPLWAIEPPPEKLLEGPLHDLEARRTSGQVLAAFDRFFTDDDENDADERLQAAFIAMAQHVAARFADEPWVVGYDLYNEPVTSDEYLWRFHERLVEGLREVDGRHLLFFEPTGVRNLTESAPTPGEPFVDADGVYAPHLYTFSFGDPGGRLETLDREDLAPNMGRAVREAESWQAPLFVGEWGISPEAPNADRYVELMYDLFDAHLASAAVWLWKERSQGSWGFYDYDDGDGTWHEREAIVAAHARAYAERIAGEPIEMRHDVDAGRFVLRYEGRSDLAPNVIHVPGAGPFADGFEVTCDGEPVSPLPERDDTTGRIEVVCAGAGERRVTVEAGG